jgi:hypothetical protein
MVKIINGAKYSTETAKRLGRYEFSTSRDFNYLCETLYRTKSGKYFLHGEGGAMSKYREHSGNNNWGGGEQIIPLTRSAAMEWAEERLDGDEYESIFGIVEETTDDKEQLKEQLNIILSVATKQKIRIMAEERNISQAELIEEIFKSL